MNMDYFSALPRLLPLLILVLCTGVPGCASSSATFHAHGTIADQTMTARVDHPVARDYLEGRPLPADLELLPGGLAIVEPGVDHYFDHPDRELRSLALLEVLLKRIGATSI
jgi:hypothetical protein